MYRYIYILYTAQRTIETTMRYFSVFAKGVRIASWTIFAFAIRNHFIALVIPTPHALSAVRHAHIKPLRNTRERTIKKPSKKLQIYANIYVLS